MLPMMMEHLPTTSDDAIKASLKMVDEADLYLGIFAYRYGYIPEGHKLSITEMEYNQAVKRKIPCLIFIMHDDHPIKGSEIEKGARAVKIEALKKRIGKAQVVNFFKSPEELAILVINSLSQHRQSDYRDGIEMDIPLKRNESDEARVIPIVLVPVNAQKTSLGGQQPLLTNLKPVINWTVPSEAFQDIVGGIEKYIEEVSEKVPSMSSGSASFTFPQEEILFNTPEKTSCMEQEVEKQQVIFKIAEDDKDEVRSAMAFLFTIDPEKRTYEMLALTEEGRLNIASNTCTTAQEPMTPPLSFQKSVPIHDLASFGKEEQQLPEVDKNDKKEKKNSFTSSTLIDINNVPLISKSQAVLQLIEKPAMPLSIQAKMDWTVVVNRLCCVALTSSICVLSLYTISFILIYLDISIFLNLGLRSMNSLLSCLYLVISLLFVLVLLLAIYIKATPFIFYLCQRALKKGSLFDDLGF
jgi:hypothetical protein